MNPTSDPAETTPTPIPSASPGAPATKPLSIRIAGVGGAGGNAVAHMAASDLRALRIAALHTSARVLDSTHAPERLLLGAELTHGVGAGGDPDLGRAAAERDLDVLKAFCEEADLLFIVAGLGGGTGTGAAPVLARVAKECGALVLGVVTLPFHVEGPRRQRQAQEGLAELKAAADGVICLPNQKMFQLVDENSTVLESFKITNDLLAQGIRGIWQMLTRPGLIHVDFADLRAILQDRHCQSSFAAVQAQGEGRARQVVEQLLACPLLDAGHALAEADAVLVNLMGGPDLSMADVKRVMEEINRRTDNAHLILGASVAPDLEGKLGITLVASRRGYASSALTSPEQKETDVQPESMPAPEIDGRFFDSPQTERASSRFVPPPPSLGAANGESRNVSPPDGSRSAGRSSLRLQQGHLPLEIVSKGRFEKTQPTIHRGEDLDVPTYIRRGTPLN
jgi:cell division protein FtsZ